MKTKRFFTLLSCSAICLSLGAWDVEHDEVAQLTGEFLPAEIKRTMEFDDFAVLMANCHFPDMEEWTGNDGKRHFRSVGDLERNVGKEDVQTLVGHGFGDGNWFHSPKGKATSVAMLAQAFGRGEHRKSAFYISVLTHTISDEGALNHPTLLSYFRYSRLPGIDFSMRKVEDGAKNVFGFRSDGHVVHLARERLKVYRPKAYEGEWQDTLVKLTVDVTMRQTVRACELEGQIAFADHADAERALVDLLVDEIQTLEDVIYTAWVHRSGRAELPGPEFNKEFDREVDEFSKGIDPRKQAVFDGVFEDALNPLQPLATVGVVCEGGAGRGRHLSFPGRILTAACARTLRKEGYAVKGLAYWEAAAGFPEPADVPILLVCIGGAGYMCDGAGAEFAAAAREYRDKGGKLIVIGGEDGQDITGFAKGMRRRPDQDIPATPEWDPLVSDDALAMSLVPDKVLKRLSGQSYRFVRSPHYGGFCKPVCRMETTEGQTLLSLDIGRERYSVATQIGNVVWLPEYALMPYLFVQEDPKLPLAALTLDGFGTKLLLDVMDCIK